MGLFNLVSEYSPTGDQPKAIEILSTGVLNREKHQVLLGVTGSGKTFTMANIISRVEKPSLVIAPNKRWQHSCIMNSRHFSRTIVLSILSLIMIIISLKPIFLQAIPISRKIHPSMRSLTRCGTLPRDPFWPGRM